ncbi:MAG: DegT/DnrJ/EryC1/StrS family aminotransferase [Verrucomicrobia bacterium]|nr:DegT/DnrJ/EryC1/StrS family aminotransferase [Verrucomicrobiota bacterium]MCG2681840.1 DegT/DnrJ/EryC1/StrS family aminotransferase [Kiritimatiellia bacterium]MBU4247722.1 DegT/DnrJ/EryC1/StrS family aminotransferase [Verrucomicrobiota bacterium]MBU4291627.1 DegT/DnrJ/EryC1/StrS family aminotransferase [Verrucomicrobiota bacterium]MBU4429556.1 DegT/DnrJ/EryC1/StrS family aminotransferase [Verrucomicrobiota bacterium]
MKHCVRNKKNLTAADLAVNGGPKTRTQPWPERGLLGQEEKSAVVAMFDRAIESGQAFGYNGPEENAFCKAFAKFMGGGYADAVNSGSTAVYVALRALNPEPFTEIIVGCITDPGGIMPIPMLNCLPMIADTAPGSFGPGPKQIEELISPRTSAIVVAHIFGEPLDMKGIMRVARKHKLPVVEDCAQAHGARIDGRLVGSFGDLSAFSLMFGKHICTGGQGGLVYTRNEKLYWACRRASDRGKPFGLPNGSSNCMVSLNFNLNDLAAAIGSAQLKKLTGIVRRRRAIVAELSRTFAKLKIVSLPEQLPGAEPSFWHCRIKFNKSAATCDKATFCKALSAEGLPVYSHYCDPIHHADWYRNRNAFGASGLPWSAPQYKGDPNRSFPCPNAEKALDDHFQLTVWESWGRAEVADIVAAFRKCAAVYESNR